MDYVHRDIFELYRGKDWLSSDKYNVFDFAGLYFTAAMLQNDGKLPWTSIRNKDDALKKNFEHPNNLAKACADSLFSGVDSLYSRLKPLFDANDSKKN